MAEESEVRHHLWSAFTAAAFLAVMPQFWWNLLPLPDGLADTATHIAFVTALLIASLVVFGVRCFLPKVYRAYKGVAPLPGLIASAVLLVAGYGAYLAGAAFGSTSPTTAVVEGACAGFGSAIIALAYAFNLGMVPAKSNAIVLFASLCGAGAFLGALLGLLDTLPALLLLLLATVVGAVGPISFTRAYPAILTTESFPEDEPGLGGRRLVSALLLAALALTALIVALPDVEAIFGIHPVALGTVLAAVLVIVIAKIRTGGNPRDFFLTYAMPVLVLVLAGLYVVAPAHLATALVAYTIFGLAVIVSLEHFTRGDRPGWEPDRMASLAGFVFCAAGLCGLWLSAFPAALVTVKPVLFIATAALGILLVASSLFRPEKQAQPAGEASMEDLAEAAKAFRQRQVETTAGRYGLSPRETAILAMIVEGHGPTYVAEELVLSPSTVRTHYNNIYRKLGVSSREEVLELLNSPTAKQ